ncbi:MAG: DUF3343 domain-containing protein, partial [Clostridia bacterium]|nr:DUF3343 domain-containing protein [Clostridia bacterium]
MQAWMTTVTMTLAMKGKRILEKQGIAAEVSRLPPRLTASGCAWGISLDATLAHRAREIMKAAGFSYGKLVYADGTPVDRPENLPP